MARRSFLQRRRLVIQKEIPGLIALARRTHIAEADWYELLELRAESIKDHLRSMTLRTVGDIQFISSEKEPAHDLNHDKPKLSEEGGFTLKTPGIFPNDRGWSVVSSIEYPERGVNGCGDAIHRFWGLTRNSEWIGIEARVHSERVGEKYRRIERATEVSIRKFASPPELCEFANRTPKQLWERLGGAVNEWVQHRERLLNDAIRLNERFSLEAQLVKEITEK